MKKTSLVSGFLFALLLPAAALAATTQISLGAGYITPSTVTINAGDTVVWSNVSSSNQNVTANNGTFQSGTIAPGGQFAATFNTAGSYNYYDNAAGNAIVGVVNVGGAGASSATYVTTPSSGATVASLTAEIQALLAEISALQGQSSESVSTGASVPASAGACPQIGRVLGVGSTGSDVSSLQTFLAADPSIYPNPQITGYFGSLTQAAVERWQAKYNIVSSGSPSTTGYGQVGPRTAAAMAIVCGGGSYNGVGPSTTNPLNNNVVSGYIQVSPISGAAPLAVTISATVNTANACGGATYTLDFGDGTQPQTMTVASGNCSQANQTFQHTYQSGGTYTITLSSGSHQSTATVTVSGAAATTTSAPTQPTGSISALVTSGPAPLNATFYVSCASGLAYDVVFGDGTDLGSTGVSQSSCNGGLQGIAHTYTSAGSYTAQLEIFVRNSNGTVSPISVASQPIVVGSGSSSSSSSGSNTTTYQPPTVNPNVGGNPLAVTLQYSYDTSGCQVSIQWGDGSAIGATSCSNFSGQQQTFTQNHTYAQGGSYTITLKRGSQTDTVGVSISN